MADGGQTQPERVAAGVRGSWWNVPNLISLTRVPLVAAFALAASLPFRLAIVAVAAVSDWADGQLARRTARTTRAGELLDPIADRIFMIGAFVTLVLDDRLAAWTLPLLLARDIGVVLGALAVWLVQPHMRLPARPAGKRVTWLQFVAVGVILLWPGVAVWVAPAIAVLGLYAVQDYGRAVRARIRARARARGPH